MSVSFVAPLVIFSCFYCQGIHRGFADFDVDRVYNTDIKKLINWYNILINSGMTDFLPQEEETQEEAKAEE